MSVTSEPAGTCPVMQDPNLRVAGASNANLHWWPNRLNLAILHQRHPSANPLDEDFDYTEALKNLDVDALGQDVDAAMTDSQSWWPADFGHYGPFFIRMSWHAAGTYRVSDGRGGAGSGAQRFAPTSSWPDNVLLDKARRLLWPVKQKYGQTVSWADLIAFAGNRALENMGFRTFGFAFGREDIWQAEEDVYWGPETEWLGSQRFNDTRELDEPFGASQMGLIYVNPQGPDGNPDPLAAAQDIRQTFSNMAMSDEETVALIAGGHTFGKTHGAAPESHKGPEPEGASLQDQGLGWKSTFGSGMGDDTVGSGIEITWTPTPTKWDMSFYDILFKYEWELTESPAGAHQWQPKDVEDGDLVPMAHDPSSKRPPMMLTTDLSLREDPGFREISERFHQNPDVFADAFARAWYKLLHRDMGPVDRYLGPLVPDEELLWQDPIPGVTHELVGDADIAALEATILESGLSVSQLVTTAWAAASTYRDTDMRGGANGARIRLSPAAEWDVNVRSGVSDVISKLEGIQRDFNADATGGKQVSLADLIVLGGCAGVEAGAKAAGHDVTVPFTPGRTDASQDQTDVDSYGYLEPKADGFRNYLQKAGPILSEHLLVDKASLLTLSAPEMTVLVGGMRALGANAGGSDHGVFTDRPGTLTNDFFVNLLDMGREWVPVSEDEDVFEGHERGSGTVQWTGTRADLIFGANSELRAVAEVYGSDGAEAKFVDDFIAAWVKVMNLDRFDLG